MLHNRLDATLPECASTSRFQSAHRPSGAGALAGDEHLLPCAARLHSFSGEPCANLRTPPVRKLADAVFVQAGPNRHLQGTRLAVAAVTYDNQAIGA